jgi:hypothetical protein
MENEQFKIEGAKEVMEAMKELPLKLQRQILKNFIRKAGKKFIVEPLKTKLHYSQSLENNIKVVTANDDKEAIQAGVTGKGYKLRWLDLGTKERKTRIGHNRGQIIGKNQIQPLIEDQVPEIIKFTEKELANEINKTLERKLKRLKKSF